LTDLISVIKKADKSRIYNLKDDTVTVSSFFYF